MNFAPTRREGELLVRRDALIAEEDDAMVKHRLVDAFEGYVVERLGKIHAVNLRPQGAGNRLHI